MNYQNRHSLSKALSFLEYRVSIAITGLKLALALKVKTPLPADSSVNIECAVEQEIALDLHRMFIGLVQAVHAEESLLDEHGDLDVKRALGIIYCNGVVREKPNNKFRVADLRGRLQSSEFPLQLKEDGE